MSGSKSALPPEFDRLLSEVRASSRVLRCSSAETRNQVLTSLNRLLDTNREAVLAANATDLANLSAETPPAFRDRLRLDDPRIDGMRESLRQVALLPDPVGEIVDERVLDNGLRAKRVRSPLGVILMIFESRPNVAIEAFSLALKSGNALILRGGKESRATTKILYSLIGKALADAGLPAEGFLGITNPDRALVSALLLENERIDVVVPRGGDGLIRFVVENALMPIIKNDRGLCHIYVHQDADLAQAARIIENAKVQRPGVCNSLETLLIHASVLEALVGELSKLPAMAGVEYRVCAKSEATFTRAFAKSVKSATETDFDTEHLDLILNVRTLEGLEEAIAHIERHGSRHSESVLTRDESVARRYQSEVDAAAVYWNASTRFTDGFELGLGGELGISTQKLHVRGPVGLRELTSVRWVIDGDGQIRN